MAENTALVKAMVTPEIRDGMERLARMNERSLSAEVRRALREHVARSSLASGAGGSVSAGLAVSSAPVASDGALAEREPTGPERRSFPTSPATDSGAATPPDAVLGVSPGPTIRVDEPGSRSASAPAGDEPEPFPLVPKLYADEAHTRYPPPKPAGTAARLAKETPGVTTGGDLAKKQVTPHLKQGQAGRKK